MKVSTFFNTDYIDAASYDNIRKICSFVDGFKNGGRKVIWTMLSKNITKGVKVTRLASNISDYTEYLHDEGALQGSILQFPKRYIGTNNMPLLTDEGNFGKRFKNEASAPRYVFTALEEYTPKIFMKVDNDTLEHQEFEGHAIEPRYMVPILPNILINGAMNGITTGWTQDILPRPSAAMLKATRAYIETGKLKLPNPGWNGFKGKVTKDPKINGKWWISGKYEVINAFGLKITELPIGYELNSYRQVLDDLEDNRVIASYEDRSKDEKFEFIIKVSKKFFEQTEDQIMKTLGLIVPYTEKYNCIGLNSNMVEFTSPEEIFMAYAEVREKHYTLRKEAMINRLTTNLKELGSKYIFIKGIVDETIEVRNKKKEVVVKQLQKNDKIVTRDGTYDYLLNMSIYNLTEEKLKKLKEEMKQQKELLEYYKTTSEKDLWLSDLDALTK